MNPTQQQYTAYAALFDYFNTTLFEGKLPPVILNFSRKSHQNLGFFAPKTWVEVDALKKAAEVFEVVEAGEKITRERLHEISVNPDHILSRGIEDALSTLVHEMVHLWEQVFAKPPKGGYHGRTWGKKMEEVGLIPSNTGKPGGKKLGVQMTHYIDPEGAFAKAVKSAPQLPFLASPLGSKAKRRDLKAKYACPQCEARAYGKQDLHLNCGDCDLPMVKL